MRPVDDFNLIIAQRRTSVLGPPLLHNMGHSWREAEGEGIRKYASEIQKKFAVQKKYIYLCAPKNNGGFV